ncbi:MAG TPA: hypothetical protein DCG53_09355 [Syntrophus sp. (in: bacteria)]|nr:hypothetical protein [Syntrophus sp. (in: bacteria)]
MGRNPKDARSYNNRGILYAKYNIYNEAIDNCNNAIELY